MKYQVLEVEEQYLLQPADTAELTILQRDSCTKLQEIRLGHQTYYHSTDDPHQHLRIAIFALLAKIYSAFTPFHQQLLNRFKQVVYNSKLNERITGSRGIEPSLLLKSFAETINALAVSGTAETELCFAFNNASFVDETILVAVEAEIDQTQHNQWEEMDLVEGQSQLQPVQAWFSRTFGIQIVQTDRLLQEEDDHQLFLRCYQNHLIRLAQSRPQQSSLVEESSETDRSRNPILIPTDYMQITVSGFDSTVLSPLLPRLNSELRNSIQSKCHSTLEQSKQHQRSTFFERFFCCAD